MPKKSDTNPCSRGWIIVINNYNDKDLQQLKVLTTTADYLIVGKEQGEKGTPHYQCYGYWKDKKTFKALKKLVPRAHLEVAIGTSSQNKEYCSKQEVVFEHGDLPVAGKRTDLDAIKKICKDSGKMADVSEVAMNPQQVRMAEIYLKYHEKARDWKPEVRWYYGSTGSGKTRAAREWLEKDIYTCLDTIKFWEGYDAHESVLIDDFRKDFCKFHQLLKLLDRYEYKVEVKGSSRQLLAKKIAITCPYPPDKVYQTREDVKQLLRRIDQVVLIGNPVHDIEDLEEQDNL